MTLNDISQTTVKGSLNGIREFGRSGLTPFCPPSMVLPKDLQVRPEDVTGYNVGTAVLDALGLRTGLKAYHVPVSNTATGQYNFYLIPEDGRCTVVIVFEDKISDIRTYLNAPYSKDLKKGFVKRVLKNTYTLYNTAYDMESSENVCIRAIEGVMVMFCQVKAFKDSSIEKAILVKPSYIFCNVSCEMRYFGWKMTMQAENAILSGKKALNYKQVKYFHLKYIGNYVINPSQKDVMKYLNEDIKDAIFENRRYEMKLKMQCFPDDVEVIQRFDLCSFDEDLDAIDIVHCYYIINTPLGHKQWHCHLPCKGIGQLLASIESVTLDSRFPLLSKALRNSSEGKYDVASVTIQNDTMYFRCDYPDSHAGEREEKLITDMKKFIVNILMEISRYKDYRDMEERRKLNQNIDYTGRMIWMHYLFQLM